LQRLRTSVIAGTAIGDAQRRCAVFYCLLVLIPANSSDDVSVERPPCVLKRASPQHLGVILELIEDTADWLRGKNTDQWATPWPDQPTRDNRVLQDLVAGRTWIVWDGTIAAGTITIDADDPVGPAGNYVWPGYRRLERALYVRRVIIRRQTHAGRGLGSALLDWASREAERKIGTPLIRIDVWTDNRNLHDYYRRQGFVWCEFRDPRALPGYPSRALFERRTSPDRGNGSALFTDGQPVPRQTCR
jgi:GNAT superfamily N-acetyltransferase